MHTRQHATRLRSLLPQLIVAATLFVAGLVPASTAYAQSSCTALTGTFGSASYTLNSVQAGSHSLWMRVKSTDGTPSLRFNLSGGGTLCNQTVATTGATAWKWVKSTGTFTTTGGTVAAQIVSNEAGLGLDCFVLTADTSFNPTTAAADCAGPQIDTTAPAVSFTAPASGATISGTVNVTANASDAESGITSVLFRVVGRNDLDFTDTTAPYANALNTSSLANGTTQLQLVATNGDGLTTTVSRTVTVSNTTPPPPDTTKPTVSITSPAAGSTVTGSSVTVTATATDNVAVNSVALYVDGSLFQTDTTSPYSFSIPNTSLVNGTHTLYAIATDTSNNTQQSTTINFTYQQFKAGDIDGNGTVDLSDFFILRTNYGKTGMVRSQGDLTGDGAVDLSDFFILRQNYGL